MNSRNNKTVLNLIAERLSAEDDVLVAVAFGSLVTDSVRVDSDLDIAILTRPPLDSRRRMELIRILSKITGRAVDLVDMRTAGVVLMRSILGHGKRMVCKDRRAYDNLVSRMLGGVADFLPYRQRLLRERRKAWIH